MTDSKPYPKYRTYEDTGLIPSLLSQEYPRPTFEPGENYYPVNQYLEPFFSTHEESRKFGAANFCGFLEDTIEVEHCLVIPAVASLRRLPFHIPSKPEQDLFKLATDEGYHAEQSLQFLTDLRSHFGLRLAEEYGAPLFLRRLEYERSLEPNSVFRDVITVLNGVITETRISVELGKFAADEYLAEAVRDICRTHAEDEAIHASQFRALGQWLWSEFDETTKTAAARFITASTIARNLPDVERLASFMHQATVRPLIECKKLVYSIYTEDLLIEILLVTARSTAMFLDKLGVNEYLPFTLAIKSEKKRLGQELGEIRKALDLER